MKKIITISLIALSLASYSQITAYRLPDVVKYEIFNGTYVKYKQIRNDPNLGRDVDSTNSSYNFGDNSCFIRGYGLAIGSSAVFYRYGNGDDDVTTADLAGFEKFTSSKDSLEKLYSNKGMSLAYATPIISAMTASINACDQSSTNEMQSLSITGQSISISGGNTIIIPTSSISITSSVITNALGYTPLSNTVTVPTNNNQLTNGNGYISSQATQTLTGAGNFSVTSGTNSFTLTQYSPTTYTASRSINSGTFQVSSTKVASGVYYIAITCTATIAGGANGKAALQYSINGGTTWIDLGEVENSNTVSLAITLNSQTKQTAPIVFNNIPAGAIFKLIPTTTNSTLTFVRGFETY